MPTRVVFLTRVHCVDGDVLWWQFDGGQPKASRSVASFIRPQHMPPGAGPSGWFEVEKVHARPWGFRRAVREVEAPEGRRAG